MSKLQSYDFEIQYIKRKKNVAVDALSRHPSFCSLSAITAEWKEVIDEYAQDVFTTRILDGSSRNKRYVIKEGMIYKGRRILLTPMSEVKKKVLHALHNTPLAGHPGIAKTYQAVRERFTFKGLRKDVVTHIQECTHC